jgi:hypothetical protein
MRFALDADARFILVASEGGWDLIFDDRRVHYCRRPADALAYMVEELTEESVADGVEGVLMALSQIECVVAKAAVVIGLMETTKTVTRVLSRIWDIDEQRARVKEASLELAGCRTTQELRAQPGHLEVVTLAKAIVGTMRKRP